MEESGRTAKFLLASRRCEVAARRLRTGMTRLPQGGAVRTATKDPKALDAVHAFLRYQITEHKTGDPLEPKR